MSLDFTITVPKDINFQIPVSTISQPKQTKAPTTQTPAECRDLNPVARVFHTVWEGYLSLTDYKETDPLWRKGVAAVATIPALIVLIPLALLDRLGLIRCHYDPDIDDEAILSGQQSKI